MHKPKTNSDNIVSIRHALSECRVYYQTESIRGLLTIKQVSLWELLCILMYTLVIPDQQLLSDIFLQLRLSEIKFYINFAESLSQTSRSHKNLKRGREIDFRKLITIQLMYK